MMGGGKPPLFFCQFGVDASAVLCDNKLTNGGRDMELKIDQTIECDGDT